MSHAWNQEGDQFRFGEISAERATDDNAFVITSFGADPEIDQVFSAIEAAMRFGKIRLRVTPQTKATIEKLTTGGRIKCVRTVGTEHEELGIMGIKRA
jgi:hypothetical protein